MENVDPRKVIKYCFKLLESYPNESLTLEIYTGLEDAVKLSEFEVFYVIKYEDNFEIGFDSKNENLNLKNVNQFLELLKNHVITIIDLTNRLGGINNRLTIFRCEDNKCLDARRFAANKIQSSFRKSRDYAAWKYHPERLRKQGYFNENGDLNDNLILENSNLISKKKIFPLSNQQVKIADINYINRNRFGKNTNSFIKSVNKDILFLSN